TVIAQGCNLNRPIQHDHFGRAVFGYLDGEHIGQVDAFGFQDCAEFDAGRERVGQLCAPLPASIYRQFDIGESSLVEEIGGRNDGNGPVIHAGIEIDIGQVRIFNQLEHGIGARRSVERGNADIAIDQVVAAARRAVEQVHVGIKEVTAKVDQRAAIGAGSGARRAAADAQIDINEAVAGIAAAVGGATDIKVDNIVVGFPDSDIGTDIQAILDVDPGIDIDTGIAADIDAQIQTLGKSEVGCGQQGGGKGNRRDVTFHVHRSSPRSVGSQRNYGARGSITRFGPPA